MPSLRFHLHCPRQQAWQKLNPTHKEVEGELSVLLTAELPALALCLAPETLNQLPCASTFCRKSSATHSLEIQSRTGGSSLPLLLPHPVHRLLGTMLSPKPTWTKPTRPSTRIYQSILSPLSYSLLHSYKTEPSSPPSWDVCFRLKSANDGPDAAQGLFSQIVSLERGHTH